MRAIIVGCGRVGAGLAEGLARAGHEVTIIDISGDAFRRLESDYPGKAVRGDGTDEDVLRRAGAEGADYFFGLTNGDNRNILTAQLAAETLGVKNVVAKVNDPVRAEAYRSLGIATICRTTMLVDALGQHASLPPLPGVSGVSGATGQHPGGAHGSEPASPSAGPAAARSHPAAAGASGPRPPEAPRAPGAQASGPAQPPGDAAGPPGHASDGTVRGVGDGDGRGRRAWKLLRRAGERGAED